MEKTGETYQGYKPPFTLSAKAVGMIADISAQIQNAVHRHKGEPINVGVNVGVSEQKIIVREGADKNDYWKLNNIK